MNKAVWVVGMHRSATSLLAKGLAQAGVHMGDRLLGVAPSNPHGHWEDVDLIGINDRILAESSASWDRPPAVLAPPSRQLATAMVRWVERRNRHPLWGCKDPRLALTWPVWLPLLDGVDLHVTTVWRHPDRVAASLNVRDGIPHADGARLARVYQKSIRRLLDTLENR